ncbi:breast carcinoma-amplified sequence 1 isoform X4 [Micropterus salmoides]|uniref:breast carcinoma-amplified sequence 1 isoform X4 n=1 Tax=Micropterus salmoides TaxID=27706 RepID=UPI0018EDE79C|nr:breast carcinoma-amplified sequence 1 isoform X4 [Micropterus salmoides]
MGNENSKNKNETSPEKHENGSVNGLSANITSNGLEIDVNSETTVKQNGGPISLNLAKETTEPDSEIVESDCKPTDAPVISDIPVTTVQEVVEEVMKSKEVKVHLFGKMFKKKAERSADVKSVQEKTTSNEDQTDVSLPATDPQPEPAILEQEPEPLREPERVTIDPGPEGKKAPETDERNSQPLENQEDSNPEKNLVMNFFKTLVTPTKTTKKETATPDATKDQSQKETQPAATTTVAQVSEPPVAPKGMSIPPPPPPEPPKMEIKGEPAAKPVKPISKEETKAAAKEPESSKGKSAKDTLSKFFRPKKVDPSKASTLEAAAKPEPPPPVQEEKKTASKSPFLSFFKPKPADPKKATPAPAAEAAPTVKAKEEPKPAAKSSEAVVDSKPASVATQAADEAANVPRKLEKRNSIHLFFKNLSQKRNSTDAGVQTEPVTVAPAEKTK